MINMLLYLQHRLLVQEYGRKEMLNLLVRRTLKSMARATAERVHQNDWIKAIEFVMRCTGTYPGHTPTSLADFMSALHAELDKYKRTHKVSHMRTGLCLDYLMYKATNDETLFRSVLSGWKEEFSEDIEWFNTFVNKVGFVNAECGHLVISGNTYQLYGTEESADARLVCCFDCLQTYLREGVRTISGNGRYILSSYAVNVLRSDGTEELRDLRQSNVVFNERLRRHVDVNWSPHANLIGEYHSSKSKGFRIIDSDWLRRHRRAFGLELEVQMVGSDSSHTRNAAAGRIHDVLNPSGVVGEYCYFEKDGSIGNGFEIVTQPAGLDVHREKMRLFLNNPDLKKGLRSHEGGACGLHVHVGRQYVTQAQIYRIQSFLNDIRNEALIRRISRRYGNNYTRIKHEMAKLSAYNKNTGDRYEALNVSNRETIEFRIFRGSLRYESVMAALEFVDALLSFCMPGQASLMEFNSIGFRRFIAKHEMAVDTTFLRPYLSPNTSTDDEARIHVPPQQRRGPLFTPDAEVPIAA